MNRWSKQSAKQIGTCRQELQVVFANVLPFFDHKILEGGRSLEKQKREIAEGDSELTDPKKGRHVVEQGELSSAVDAAPYPVLWPAHANTIEAAEWRRRRFYAFGGFVKGVASKMGIELRWGGDWDGDWTFSDQEFHDLVHFELIE